MDQRRIWKGWNINALCWAFFCVNDKNELDNKSHQLMRCFLCYLEVVKVCNKRTNEIFYYKTNGITPLKNHVDAYHVVLDKKIEEKVNNFLKGIMKRSNMLKNGQVFLVFQSLFFCCQKSFQGR
jgi:hypothetical protein